MKKKLSCVLLIDDDEATNAFNELILIKADCTEHIQVCDSAVEALEFLRTPRENGECPQPAIIFLDINMPDMNGWEFLDVYGELEVYQQGEVVVVMLTTSLNPDDVEEADRRGVGGFIRKPLTVETVLELIRTRLPQYHQ